MAQMGGARSLALTAYSRWRSLEAESDSRGAGIPRASVSLHSGKAPAGVLCDGVYQPTAGTCGCADHNRKGIPQRPLPYNDGAVPARPAVNRLHRFRCCAQ